MYKILLSWFLIFFNIVKGTSKNTKKLLFLLISKMGVRGRSPLIISIPSLEMRSGSEKPEIGLCPIVRLDKLIPGGVGVGDKSGLRAEAG